MITALAILACLLLANVLLLIFSVNKIPSEKEVKLKTVSKETSNSPVQVELKEAV